MKIKGVLLAATILIFLSNNKIIYADPDENKTDFIIDRKCSRMYDFRCIKWGMPQEEVEKSELPTKAFAKNKVKLIYKTQYKGLNTNLQYIFNLVNVLMYSSYIVYVNPAQSKTIYEDIKKDYTNKFGEPIFYPRVNTHKFNSGDTNIYLGITNTNDKINIVYTPMDFIKWSLFLIEIQKYF